MNDKTEALRQVLEELVAIEDLRKSIAQANHHAAQFPTDENYAVADKLHTEIASRKPIAWAAARAALAQQAATPKPLDDPRLQELFSNAIDGALTLGYQNSSQPPDGHWLARFWDIGRQAATPASAAPDERFVYINSETPVSNGAPVSVVAIDEPPATPAPAEPVATITEIEYDYPWRVNVRFDVAVLAREKRGVVAGAKLYVAPPIVPAEQPQGEQA